jgi:phosphoenolpyruvate carboxylase
MKCYYHEIKRLELKLTFRGIANDIARLREQLYLTIFDPFKTISTEEILEVLNRVKASLTKNFNGLCGEELISLLVHAPIQVHPDQFQDETVKDTLRTILQIKSIQSKNGEQSCNRYIISNSEDIFSVLFVYALLRWSC